MDPLAIAGFATTSAASCLKLSSLLYTYIEEVRDVDSIVSALGSDLKMLSTSLDGISTTLQEHGTNITAKLDKSAKLFKSLSICPKLKELTLLKGKVTSFHTAMNLNLDMINVCLILQTHDRMTSQEKALTGIRNLECRMEELFKRLNLDDSDSYEPSQLFTFRQCLHSAQSVRYTASTILDDGESMAVPSESEVRSHSVLGTSSAIQKVTLWLSSSHLDLRGTGITGHLEAISESVSSDMTGLSVTKPGGEPSSPLGTGTSTSEIRDRTEIANPSDINNIQTTQRHRRKHKQPDGKTGQGDGTGEEDMSTLGRQASEMIELGHYGEAEHVLMAMLQQVKPNCGMGSLEYRARVMLGECYLGQGKLTLAEDTLLPLYDYTPELSHGAISARLSMSKVFYGSGRVQPARHWAKKAISIAEFTFSDNHPLFKESIEFLAILHDHLGASEEAEAARSLLSVTSTEAMFNEFRSSLTQEGLVPAAQYVVKWILKFHGQVFMREWEPRIKIMMEHVKDESDLLALVAIAGHGPWVQLLLSRGAVATRSIITKSPPFSPYAYSSCLEIDNFDHDNSIHFALKLENYTVCRMLLDTMPVFDVCEFMCMAAERKNWAMVRLLVPHHRRCRKNTFHECQITTALREAVKNHVGHLINPLINEGASLNSIIFTIIDQKMIHLLKLLLGQQNLNVRGESGITPLAYAVTRKRFEMVVLMLDAGVDVQFPCVPYENAREMPLFVAVNNSCVDVMKELLRRGANPNSYASVLMKGSRRTTYPLHCAVKMTNLKAVDILLQNRAAVNTRDGFGKTPLEIAGQVALDNPQLSNNLLEIIRLLRRKGGIMGTWMRFKLKGLKRSSRDSILSALGSEISN